MTQTTFSPNGHKRAVLYARVSSDDRSKDGRNLAGQIEMGRKYAQEHSYTIVAELAEDDKGASGASFELPQLNNVLMMAERREFDVLVVRELDRLSRNLAKQLNVEEALRRAGVIIEYVLGEYPDTPEGNLNKHIRATIAEFEREKIKERNLRGRRNIVKNGKIMLHGNRPPYGYRLSDDGKNLAIHEEEARIVRLIFQWYTEGDENGGLLSSAKIAKRLSEKNAPSWCDVHQFSEKKMGFGQWTDTMVLRIIHCETYKGDWHYGRYNPKAGKQNPRDYWLTLKVPAIVDPDQWDAAQEMCKQNVVVSRRNVAFEYLMRYRAKCSCGYSMGCASSSTKGKMYLYYLCRGTYKMRASGKCKIPSFRADHVDALVWNWLKEWFRDPADLRNKLEVYKKEREQANAPIIALLQANEDLIADNQAQLDRLLDLYQSGGIKKEKYTERQMRLEETIAGLKQERDKLQARLNNELSQNQIEDLIIFAYELALGLLNADKSFETRRHIIEMLDVNCIMVVENGQKVVYTSFVLTKPGERGHRIVLPKRGEELDFVVSTHHFQKYRESGITADDIYDPALLATFGLPPDATLDMIRIKFRELAKKHHPDLGGDHNKMIEVLDTYRQLTNDAPAVHPPQ